MYIAYVPFNLNSQILCKLALVPDRSDESNAAIPIDSLPTGGSAIIRVGHGDCCTVIKDNNSLIIKPVTPAKIYLTPDLPDKPGVSVQLLKIESSNGDYNVYYAEARGSADDYKQWEPTKLRL